MTGETCLSLVHRAGVTIPTVTDMFQLRMVVLCLGRFVRGRTVLQSCPMLQSRYECYHQRGHILVLTRHHCQVLSTRRSPFLSKYIHDQDHLPPVPMLTKALLDRGILTTEGMDTRPRWLISRVRTTVHTHTLSILTKLGRAVLYTATRLRLPLFITHPLTPPRIRI